MCCGRLAAPPYPDERGWCKHCKRGQGCAIYEQRPQPCRDFTCLWLAVPQLDDSLRPDRIKVIFTLAPDGKLIAHCDSDRPYAWHRPQVIEGLRRAARINGHSLVRVGENSFFVVTPERSWEAPPEAIVRKADGAFDVMVPYFAGLPVPPSHSSVR